MKKLDQDVAAAVLRDAGMTSSKGKAGVAGIGGALTVLTLWAIGSLTGAVDVPDASRIEEAIGAIVLALVTAAGLYWRVYAIPYLRRLVVLFAAVGIVVGCTTLRTAADRPEAEAFRQGGLYFYIMIPAATYLGSPEARPDVADVICRLEGPAYAGVTAAADAAIAGADELGAALAAAAAAVADLDLQVLGGYGLSASEVDGEELGTRSVFLAGVALRSAGQMNAWRTGYLTPKLEAMVAGDRAPTPAEWSTLRERMDAMHATVETACP